MFPACRFLRKGFFSTHSAPHGGVKLLRRRIFITLDNSPYSRRRRGCRLQGRGRHPRSCLYIYIVLYDIIILWYHFSKAYLDRQNRFPQPFFIFIFSTTTTLYRIRHNIQFRSSNPFFSRYAGRIFTRCHQ